MTTNMKKTHTHKLPFQRCLKYSQWNHLAPVILPLPVLMLDSPEMFPVKYVCFFIFPLSRGKLSTFHALKHIRFMVLALLLDPTALNGWCGKLWLSPFTSQEMSRCLVSAGSTWPRTANKIPASKTVVVAVMMLLLLLSWCSCFCCYDVVVVAVMMVLSLLLWVLLEGTELSHLSLISWWSGHLSP